MGSDNLSRSEVKNRSLKGVKWLVLTNGFGIPAGFLISLLLGWTGPAALGAFALAQVFIAVITTFSLFGGHAILPNFIPKILKKEQRGQFLFSYFLIVSITTTLVLLVFYFFPQIPELLFQRPINPSNFGMFILLTLAAVTAEYLMGASDGLMHIKLAAVARLMARIVILPLVIVLYLLNSDFLLANTLEILLIGFMIAYLIGAMLCVNKVIKDPRISLAGGWYLPIGFGSFALTSFFSLVFSFIYNNFDRIFILYYGDLQGLGKYQAVLSLALLIEYIPNLLKRAMVPTFSSLVASNSSDSYQKAFQFIYRYSVVFMTLVALLMMAFSFEMLAIFGEEYTEYFKILCLFSFANIVRSHSLATGVVLTTKEKNSLRLSISFIQVAIQIVGTLLFFDMYGLMAIVVAKLAAVIIASSINHYYVIYHMKMASGLPRVFISALVCGLLLYFIRVYGLSEGWWENLLLASLAIVIFLLLAKVRLYEFSALVAKLRKAS